MIVNNIEMVENFGQLYDFIRGKGQIQGSKAVYQTGDLIDLIEDIRTELEKQKINKVTKPEIQAFIKRNNPLFEKITRAQGLRKKVIELSIKEVRGASKEQ
jgi:hypothetical protein